MNPFLDLTFPPNWKVMNAESIEPAVKEGIREAEAALEKIKGQDLSGATYASTYQELEDATESLSRAWGRVNHLDSVANNEEQREALNKMLPTVTDFYSGIPLDAKLWKVLKAVRDGAEYKTLSPIFQRHIDETCADFINAGADLSDDKKARYADVQAELSQKTQKFSENVLDTTNDWELILNDTSRLAGLPESAIAAAKADALANKHGSKESPKYRFTLQYPSLIPVMQYGEDETLRKELWEANRQVGWKGEKDNSDLVREIIALRKEKTALLGYESFADWTTSRRMAKSGQNALNFIEDLHGKIKPAFDKECVELQEYKAHHTGREVAPLEPWETGYWSEKRRKEEYDFDEEELRPYFPLDQVMSGMFELASTLFGVDIQESEAPPSWHDEVTFYKLIDKAGGEHLGSFYADWHPRESKRGGAWMNSFETGLPPMGGQEREPHLGLICGNMTKPVGNAPALMTHNEVLTIFHEFGHLIHQLLSNVEVKALAGTNVAWDFVELPSQLLENFCWARKSLDFFAKHYETGETIPEKLFQKMISAKNYMSATGFMRQLSFGKLDLELHLRERDLSPAWEEIDDEILKGYEAPLATQSASMVRRFSHLFSSPTGYAAGYYSYKWAEVLDADAFTKFEKEGLLNPETGILYRETILSKGNSAPPEKLYKDFMGREPSQIALLKREGLL